MRNDNAEDDAVLVRATLGGRAQAFGLLYDRYAPLVRAICFDGTGDLTSAQDVSQEAFLRALRKLGELRKPEQFAPWLIGIAKHLGREWRRGAGRRRRHAARIAELADVRRGATECETASGGRDDAKEDLRELRDAIAALPAREREALHLFYLQEQPADVAAKVLGLSRSGFYRALERAKKRIQRILGLHRSRGVTP
jgi:RNA polymerase sigma-70 factor (ECF subfamily)